MTTPRVMLVDGDAETRTILRAALEHYGYAVAEAAQVEPALELARRERPDVVVTELWVPGSNGSGVLAAALRRDPAARDARIVVLTTRSQPSDAAAARRAGADLMFTKPVDLRGLLADLGRLARAGAGPTA